MADHMDVTYEHWLQDWDNPYRYLDKDAALAEPVTVDGVAVAMPIEATVEAARWMHGTEVEDGALPPAPPERTGSPRDWYEAGVSADAASLYAEAGATPALVIASHQPLPIEIWDSSVAARALTYKPVMDVAGEEAAVSAARAGVAHSEVAAFLAEGAADRADRVAGWEMLAGFGM
jgi:hypothetical protein